MGNIITDILKIEADAQKRVSDAEQEGIRIIAEAKIQRDEIINSKIQETENKIKKINSDEKIKAEEKLSKIKQNGSDEIANIDAVYNLNHSEWEESIFNQIINS